MPSMNGSEPAPDAHYWTDFWQAHGRSSRDLDGHRQVLRTVGGLPLSEPTFTKIVADLSRKLVLAPDHRLLDVCCGNGLLTAHFAPQVAWVDAFDVSSDLVAALRQRQLTNVDARTIDARQLELPESHYDRILLYAAIQYFTLDESVRLLQQLARTTVASGRVVIGDVPDARRQWAFFNTRDREAIYFSSLLEHRPLIGTWFDPEWMQRACCFAGFDQVEIVAQDCELPYAHFRFDVVCQRN